MSHLFPRTAHAEREVVAVDVCKLSHCAANKDYLRCQSCCSDLVGLQKILWYLRFQSSFKDIAVCLGIVFGIIVVS